MEVKVILDLLNLKCMQLNVCACDIFVFFYFKSSHFTYIYFSGISPPQVLANVGDICASFQYSALTHIAKRLQRALLYCEMTELLPNENKTLVGKHLISER